MEHIGNIYDSRLPNARIFFTPEDGGAGSPYEQWMVHLAWVAKLIIGRPVATEAHTVEQLEAMHMVGLYKEDGLPAGDQVDPMAEFGATDLQVRGRIVETER